MQKNVISGDRCHSPPGPSRSGKGLRLTIFWVVASLFLIALYSRFVWNRGEGEIKRDAVIFVRTAEALLHPEHIADISIKNADENKHEYLMAKAALVKMVETGNLVYHAYIFGRDGKEIFFVLDSEPSGSSYASSLGKIYGDAGGYVSTAFESGKPLVTEKRTDVRGRWVSALAPIKDPASGETVAVLMVDFSAAEWDSRLIRHMIPTAIIITSLIFLILVLIYNVDRRAVQKRLSEELALNESLYRSIFEEAQMGIAIVNNDDVSHRSDFHQRNINPRFAEILGRTQEELLEVDWTDITHPDDLQADLDNFGLFVKGDIDGYVLEKRFFKPDGSIVWTYMKVSKLHSGPGALNSHLCMIEDITAKKQIEDRLRYTSEHDTWTGLYNRRYLEGVLKSDAGSSPWIKRALVGINLSPFNTLASSYGFNYTRALVKRVVEELSVFRSEEIEFFSTFENRFSFYFKGYEDRNLLIDFCDKVAKKLDSLLSSERVWAGLAVMEIPREGAENTDLLLKKLLLATEKSINIFDKNIAAVFYDDEMESEISRERDITEALEDCIAPAESGGLYLQYQPMIDLKTGRIIGFEALARLLCQRIGRVDPLEFIPLAERTKLIYPMGRRIFEIAFNFMNRLKEEGFSSLSVSVNVSALQLLEKDFAADVIEMASGMGVTLGNLCVEITESVFAPDHKKINHVLSELRKKGIKVSLDDFGTGYSSFARERELSIDSLKIDKYFIDKLLYVRSENSITSDIISMAHKLGHSVTAEGVEHESQLMYLRQNDCDIAQGYFFSKPLDEDAAIDLLKKNDSFL